MTTKEGGQTFKIRLTRTRISILSGQKTKEIGRYSRIRGPEVSEVIKVIEGRLDEEIKIKKEVESLNGKIITEF